MSQKAEDNRAPDALAQSHVVVAEVVTNPEGDSHYVVTADAAGNPAYLDVWVLTAAEMCLASLRGYGNPTMYIVPRPGDEVLVDTERNAIIAVYPK